MNTSTILFKQEPDELYEGQWADNVITMGREYGKSPNGNHFCGNWVLRCDGDYVDHDQYRYDLASRQNCILKD